MAKNPKITIAHIATGLFVKISDYFFTEFSDTIDTQYNSVQTFGRMDPIVNYQGATRKISLGIKRITTESSKRITTHQIISRLQKMQYPVYEKARNALTIQRPPIVAVSLGNLIRDGNGQPLICAMNGFAFTPSAGFTPEDSPYVRFGGRESQTEGEAAGTSAKDDIGFKTYNMKFDFTVLHQSPMGFQKGSEVFDPDANVTVGKDMKFLGGYAFGPRKISGFTDSEVQVYSADSDNEQGVQSLADVADIFSSLDIP